MLNDIQQGRYVSLATFRKNGAKVATPVWMAPAVDQQPAQDFYIFSAGNAGKVKRLRSNSEVALALCDFRGNLASDWCTASAELVVEDASIQQALAALRGKYGWQMWLADVGAQLTGKFSKRAYIRVRFRPS
jgi:PPOX class probable F420-dependent enzyme